MAAVTSAAASALLDRVRALAAEGDRVLIGITGAPAAGKSTLAEWLAETLTAEGLPTAWVPMDGFHLADAALDRLGRRERKGALDTFDGHGYLALLRRLRAETRNTVYAPAFERNLEQPIANSIGVPPETAVIVTEGNYLLVDEEPWRQVRAELTEVWYSETDPVLRRERLVARHIRFGKAPDAAAAWADTVDEPNARLIAATRARADTVIDFDALDLGIVLAD
ncbi:nucleoside/nucleotide kinase family protein [Naasia aerilata]|uniref:Nucleoside/nucleotide kinase family protein n=1 Tax=Naasia aerilata TaxID=1162966 RepID=A0ABN6XQH8_9MICO|nr:nucleoside/nucleotide kinase family protein [Naasia aerilata]BDZ47242.1 nucleoside/nucleotide kinase family protein [Naasia aerilata]